MTQEEFKSLNDALFEACEKGDTAKVQRLLDLGADLKLKNEDGWSVLAMAAVYGHTETLNVLINHGAGLNSKDNNGLSVLARAAMCGHTETALVLLDHGADLESQDNEGRSALAWAADNGKTGIVLALISRCANVSGVLALPQASEFTASIREYLDYPLHHAAAQGLAQECIQLLKLGYDADQKNKQSLTPLQCAEQKNQGDTQSFLRSWQARKLANQVLGEIAGIKP